jgi:plastocyanin
MQKPYFTFLLSIFIFTASQSFSTVWIVTNSGITFSPATITINAGDTVMFNIASNHTSEEVSLATWNANNSTSNGGFSLPFGGGMIVPTQVKTYYYVCIPHAGAGMKGQIIVNLPTGISQANETGKILKMTPNPTSNFTQIHTGLQNSNISKLIIFDITGKEIYRRENVTNNFILDVTSFKNGIYLVRIELEGYIRTSKLIVSK